MLQQESDLDPDIQIALQAVRKASVVTTRLQREIGDIAQVTKTDASPVTVADFCSQAIVLQHLSQHFPEDLFLAEESSDNLTPAVTNAILQALAQSDPTTTIADKATLCASLDWGQTFFQQHNNNRRIWCLDPIDGTKGFLRKEQYCVALALLQHTNRGSVEPAVGILACPNLAYDDQETELGCIFVAQKGKGCYQLPLDASSNRRPMIPLHSSNHPKRDASKARFCVGVEQAFGDPVGTIKNMARRLHGRLDDDKDNEIAHVVRMDSQAKYGVVARGDAEFYVRLPSKPDWMWDVAAGVVVLEEAGGVVTDAAGGALDFTQDNGRLASCGVLGATSRDLHQALLDSCRQQS